MTIFRKGKGENRRDINITKCSEALALKRCKALVVFHVFTGCDQTGRFNNKSKTACVKAFLGSSNIILQAFSRLGEKENSPSLETLVFFIIQSKFK